MLFQEQAKPAVETQEKVDLAKLRNEVANAKDKDERISAAVRFVDADKNGNAVAELYHSSAANGEIRDALFLAIQATKNEPPAAILSMVKQIFYSEPERRLSSLSYLINRKYPEAERLIAAGVSASNLSPYEKFLLVINLGSLATSNASALDLLFSYATSAIPEVRMGAFAAAGSIKSNSRFRTLPVLYRGLEDFHPLVRYFAGRSVAQLGDLRTGMSAIKGALPHLTSEEQFDLFTQLASQFEPKHVLPLAVAHLRYLNEAPSGPIARSNVISALQNYIQQNAGAQTSTNPIK